MPPKAASSSSKAKPLIKGQGSLQGYFSGGGMTRVDQSGASNTSPPKKKELEKEVKAKEKVQEKPKQEVKEMKEPITIRGYTPGSMTPSPSKSKAPPVRPRPTPKKEEAVETASSTHTNGSQSKYFPSGTKKGKVNEKFDDVDEEEDFKPAKKRAPASTSNPRKRRVDDDDDYEEDEAPPKVPQRSKGRPSANSRKSPDPKQAGPQAKKARKQDSEDEDSSDIEMVEAPPPRKKKSSAPKAGSSKNDSITLDDDDDDDQDGAKKPVAPKNSASAKNTPVKSPAVPPASSVAPKSEIDQGADHKAAVKAARDRAAQGPSAPGSKEIPRGAPNCLLGLTFVFTGQLESLEREEAQSLVKGLGAKVTGAPSSKTSYVVVGEAAGPAKLKKIQDSGIKTIDEDGLLELIRSRAGGKPDAAAMKKLAEEEKKIEKAAMAMEVTGGGTGIGHKGAPAKPGETDVHALWTTKYAPSQMKDLVGNNAAIDKLKAWLEGWPASYKSNFKKPGKFGAGCFRAIMISGPPGIGKTSAAHLVARMCGYAPIELNASDARSKKLIEHNLKSLVNNKSLDGWYGGGGGMTVDGITIRDNTVLILDEVDGMSGGDRGGVGAINQLIKKTRIPIILICNDRKSPKMKPFDHTTFGLPFQRPKADSIRSRLQTIAFREKLKVDKTAMDELISAAQNDIRLVINMLATWKLGQSALNFDESKKLGSENVKPGMPTPWSLYSDLASHGLWGPASKKTLNQKADLYFHDMGMVPLFVQENYIRQRPQRAANAMGESKDMQTLRLLSGAATAISDGDVIDNMIHGAQQQWTLLPLHAVVSTLKPMSLVYGMGPEGSYGASFPAWFGQNSKQGRLFRATVELQTKMRLTASGSRHEVREQYLPHLFTRLSHPLQSKGSDGVSEVIEVLDDYYLNLEDRDNILELGVGCNNGDDAMRKVPSAVKSAFTRQYNAASHPIALQKGDLGSGGRAKQLVGDAAPDAEEAIIQDDVAEDSGSEFAGDSDDDLNLTKDKMIKEKKQKASKGKAKSKA